MKYSESIERSAEYLRLAIPLMSKQAAALHPVSYAVWYEYVAGINPSLKASIDSRTRKGAVLDEQTTLDLYQTHIAEIDETVSRNFSEGCQRVLADISRSASRADDDVGKFGRVLEACLANLAEPGRDAELGAAVDLLLHHTRNMQESIAFLKTRLDESSQEIELLRSEVSRARRDALLDSLTGLTNRKGFDIALAACLAASAGRQVATSLLMADIDHFKLINDRYGHLFGDKVLRIVARILKSNVKGQDMAARYGGEEFVVLLPDTPLDGARGLAEKIRLKVGNVRIKRTDNDETVGNVTLSVGVAAYRPGESAHDFLVRADGALYASKEQGRNRVTVAEASASAPHASCPARSDWRRR